MKSDENKLDALYYLGYLYENGFGLGQDIEAAKRYYEKAASAREPHALSLNKLGDIWNEAKEGK